MALKIPRILKVGAGIYDIEYDATIRDDNKVGVTYPSRRLIRIDPNVPRVNQEETFIHEMLHTCCVYAGINYSETLTEEEFISRISPILHTVLTENRIQLSDTENGFVVN